VVAAVLGALEALAQSEDRLLPETAETVGHGWTASPMPEAAAAVQAFRGLPVAVDLAAVDPVRSTRTPLVDRPTPAAAAAVAPEIAIQRATAAPVL